MLQGPGIGDDAPGGNGPVAQGPEKLLEPLFLLARLLHLGQGAGHALIGGVDLAVDLFTGLALEAVFLVPDVHRGGLECDLLCFFGH